MHCPKCGRKMEFTGFDDVKSIKHDPEIFEGKYRFRCPRCASVIEYYRTKLEVGEWYIE